MGRKYRNSSALYCDVENYVYYNPNRPDTCIPCPKCPKGKGLGPKRFQKIKYDQTHGALQCLYCIGCKHGYTYSESLSYEGCKQCSDCKVYGMVELKPCRRSEDVTCKLLETAQGDVTTSFYLIKNNHIHHYDNGNSVNKGLLITVVVLAFAVLLFICREVYKRVKRYFKKRNRRRKEKVPLKQTTDEESKIALPQQENMHGRSRSEEYTGLKIAEVATSDDDYDYPFDKEQRTNLVPPSLTLAKKTDTKGQRRTHLTGHDTDDYEYIESTLHHEIINTLQSDEEPRLNNGGSISPNYVFGVSPEIMKQNTKGQDSDDKHGQPMADFNTVTDAVINTPIDVSGLKDIKDYNKPLTEKQLRVAAKPLAGNNAHQKFSAFLGVEKADLDVITTNHPQDALEQSYQVLVKWQQLQGENARKDKLFSALEEFQRSDVINVIVNCK